jgi:hypothetical protein
VGTNGAHQGPFLGLPTPLAESKVGLSGASWLGFLVMKVLRVRLALGVGVQRLLWVPSKYGGWSAWLARLLLALSLRVVGLYMWHLYKTRRQFHIHIYRSFCLLFAIVSQDSVWTGSPMAIPPRRAVAIRATRRRRRARTSFATPDEGGRLIVHSCATHAFHFLEVPRMNIFKQHHAKKLAPSVFFKLEPPEINLKATWSGCLQ